MHDVGEYIQNKVSGVCKTTVKEVDRILFEFMNKKGLTIADLQGNVVIQREENDPWETGVNIKTSYWYKGELMIKVTQKYDITKPFVARAEMIIEKGDW